MIRTCDGTDANLKRELVTNTSPAGQEKVEWVSCDCGLAFDDVERLVVYPHHFIPNREDKAALVAAIDQMVKDDKSAEEIRIALQQLTSQPVAAKVEPTPTTTEGSPMGDGEGFAQTEDNTEVVSAEGTADTEADKVEDESDSDAKGDN